MAQHRSKKFITIESENPMWWRSASAAYQANLMEAWPDLPPWHQAWVIATVETSRDINNAMTE